MYTDLIDQMALECYYKYENINFMLSRPRENFQEDGRAQNEIESVQIDLDIIRQFNQLGIPYTQIEGPDNATTAYHHLVKLHAH